MTRTVLATLVALLATGSVACGGEGRSVLAVERPDGAGGPAAFLRIAPAVLDTQGAALVAQGSVAFDEERVAAIIPPVQGRVIRLLARTGDRVEPRTPLAELYSAEVAGAGAGLSEARINRVAAETAVARAERLLAEGAGSQRDLADARTALATARAEEARATASLQAMGAPTSAAATYTLRAPIGGTVVRRSLRVGAEARPDASEPAFLIADLARVWVLAYLHEGQSSVVHRGDAADIEVPAVPGRHFTGTVARVADAVDPNTRTLVVRIELDNPGNILKPDMFARVVIRTQATNIVLLPTTAFVTQHSGFAVFVETRPNHFERRAVTLGAELDGATQVLPSTRPGEGVLPGERVVIEGALLLDASLEQVL